MADITVTAAQVAAVYPLKAEIYNGIATESITAGQALYMTSAGKYGVADANASGKQQFRGIALNAAGAGQAVNVLRHGHIAGFTLGTYDSLVYLSDTAGVLGDAAGTMSVRVGRVDSISDTSLTKVLFVEVDFTHVWS